MKKANNRHITLGIFLDYIMETNYSREGISRYLFNLLDSLLKTSDIKIEIWTRILNKNLLESEYLQEIIFAYPERVKICYETEVKITNKSIFLLCIYEIYNILIGRTGAWRSVPDLYNKLIKSLIKDEGIVTKISGKIIFILALISRALYKKILYNFIKIKQVNETHLVKRANNISEADLFIIPYVGILSSYFLKHKKLLVLHDLFSLEYEERFKIIDPSITEFNESVLEFCNTLSIEKGQFICHSKHIKNIIEKYIERAKVYNVYLPGIELKSVSNSKENLLKKFRIKDPFIFYPTQLRPYKNVEIILEAMFLLKERGVELTLVLTGKMSSYPPVLELCHKLNLTDLVMEIGSISQEDLYGLYKIADLSVVPTLSEGGFPWQALEAIYCSCPVVLSDIPVVTERLEFARVPEGIIKSMNLFEPRNSEELSRKIIYCLENKNEITKKQHKLAEYIGKYSWKDVADSYMGIFEEIISEK